ncbi:MAG: alpha/beta hydrolase [Thermoplasmata archaeon]
MKSESPSNWPALERGSGPAVVFLHGYPLNHSMWTPQLEDLSFSHHVILLDLPGYGLAGDWSVPDTLSGFAESVHRTLIERFSTPVAFVGHSFGGYVAIQLFRDHPEQFRALILTNTRSEPDSPEAKEKRLALAARLEDPTQSLEVDEVARSLVAPATWHMGGPVVENVRSMVREARPATIRSTLRAIADRPDSTPVLPNIRVPALVVWGSEDRLIPPQQTQLMVPRIPGGTGVGIAGAGHLPSLEKSQAFSGAVRDFLGRIPEKSPGPE